eukprot:UN17710
MSKWAADLKQEDIQRMNEIIENEVDDQGTFCYDYFDITPLIKLICILSFLNIFTFINLTEFQTILNNVNRDTNCSDLDTILINDTCYIDHCLIDR